MASAQSPAQCFLIVYDTEFLSMTAISLLLAGTFPFNDSIIVVVNRVVIHSAQGSSRRIINSIKTRETRDGQLNTGTKISPVMLSCKFSSYR